jgi:hypothetical protein
MERTLTHDPSGQSPHQILNGHFFLQVRQKDDDAWNWCLRVEVVATGDWVEFHSFQEALWFMRRHLAAEEEMEGPFDLPALPLVSQEPSLWEEPVSMTG